MASEEPLCRLFEFSINQLRDCIERGEVACARMTALRRIYFSIVHNLPVTCRYILLESKSYASFDYVLFYERVRLGFASPHFKRDAGHGR